MKVIKIKTQNPWNELTVGKVYTALPREDTLAPYINRYIWFGGQISQKLKDEAQYYLIKETDLKTTKYFYPVSEFEPLDENREGKISLILGDY
jgi:hypothetical protein